MDWENHLEKNPIQTIEKQVKIKVKLPNVNKKPLARQRIFVQTPFSPSTLKLEQKIPVAKPLAFLLHFLFWRDQDHYSNLTSKIMKMCEQILKKHSAPIQFKLFELQKNHEKVNNSLSYGFAAIKKVFEN